MVLSTVKVYCFILPLMNIGQKNSRHGLTYDFFLFSSNGYILTLFYLTFDPCLKLFLGRVLQLIAFLKKKWLKIWETRAMGLLR